MLKVSHIMRLTALLLGGFLAGLLVTLPAAADVTGKALVIDADTIEVDGKVFDLWGIDSLEKDQTCLVAGKTWNCGREALNVFKRLADGRPVTCKPQLVKGAGGNFAECRVGGLDLSREMVRLGYAFAYTRFTQKYIAAQVDARDAKIGMFRGQTLFPWEWRRGRRLPPN